MANYENMSMYEELNSRYAEISAMFTQILGRLDGVEAAIAEQTAVVT